MILHNEVYTVNKFRNSFFAKSVSPKKQKSEHTFLSISFQRFKSAWIIIHVFDIWHNHQSGTTLHKLRISFILFSIFLSLFSLFQSNNPIKNSHSFQNYNLTLFFLQFSLSCAIPIWIPDNIYNRLQKCIRIPHCIYERTIYSIFNNFGHPTRFCKANHGYPEFHCFQDHRWKCVYAWSHCWTSADVYSAAISSAPLIFQDIQNFEGVCFLQYKCHRSFLFFPPTQIKFCRSQPWQFQENNQTL